MSEIASIIEEPNTISVMVDNRSTGKIIEDKRYQVKTANKSNHKYNNSDLS
jgi:hypothetical protein